MKSSRRTFSLTFALVLLAGLALWYFRSKPAAPQAAVAQTPTASPVAKPRDEPFVAQQTLSEVGQPAPTAPAAEPQSALQTTTQPLAQLSVDQTTKPASPAAAKPDETRAQPYAVSAAVPQSHPEEIAATARMYAAHASLRTPEVADPDSKANKQILQTMVLKALARQDSAPTPVPVSR